MKRIIFSWEIIYFFMRDYFYLRSWCGQHWKQADNPCPSHFGICTSRGKCFCLPVLSKKELGRFHMQIFTVKCFWLVGFQSPPKRALKLLEVSLSATCLGVFCPQQQFGYFWNLGDSRWCFTYEWNSLAAGAGQGAPGEPSQIIHSSELVQGRGKSSQTTTHWVVCASKLGFFMGLEKFQTPWKARQGWCSSHRILCSNSPIFPQKNLILERVIIS